MAIFKKDWIWREDNLIARRDILVMSGLILAGVLLLALGVIIFEINVVNFSGEIILHFDFFQGITLVGGAEKVYRIFILAGFVEFLNISLAWFFLRRHVFLSYLFSATSLLFSGLIFTALLVIMAVN